MSCPSILDGRPCTRQQCVYLKTSSSDKQGNRILMLVIHLDAIYSMYEVYSYVYPSIADLPVLTYIRMYSIRSGGGGGRDKPPTAQCTYSSV